MRFHPFVLSRAVIMFNVASASLSSSSEQRTSQHQSRFPTLSISSRTFSSASNTSIASSTQSTGFAVVGNSVGEGVASRVLAVLLANVSSESTGASATTFYEAPKTESSTATSSPCVSLACGSSALNSTSVANSTSFSLTGRSSASASKPRSYAGATSLKPTSSSASASFPTQASSKGSVSQASATSVPTATSSNGNGTTITSPPAGFTTFTASNSLWTSDTTTVIHGDIIPVLYLGKHKGIELEGLGGKPNDPVRPGCSGLFRSIIGCGTWIKLPGLPTFEISPGGVPIPQEPPTDPNDPGDPGNDGNPDDPDDQNQSAELTSRAHEKTSLKSENRAPSTTSQSRIKTAASVRPSSAHSISQAVPSTKSSAHHSSSWTTASESTASHSSAASASATTTKYIIRLQPAISATQLEDIVNNVKAHASNMYSIPLGSRPNDTVICAKLNGSSYVQFNDNKLVLSMLLDQKLVLEEDLGIPQTGNNNSLSARSISKRLIDNRGTYSYQSDPFVPELNFVSQPRNTILDQMASFGFPSTAGEGVDVYVPDSGVNTANNEFINMKGGYRWLEPPQGTWPGSKPWAPIDPTGHGTCVADKVAGYNYGVAKNVNLVLLRLPEDEDDEIFNSGVLLVFRMMVADIQERKANGYTKIPVVSISWGTTSPSEEFTEILFQAISNLMDQGTVLCILSGNMAAESYNVNAWPALAKERLDNIILVGAVDNDGLEASFSQGGHLVDVWAPGVKLMCALGAGDGKAPSPGRSGTSYATPQVAALAAIFIVAYGMETVEQVKETIMDQAYSRNGGPDAIYIGNSGDFCRTRRKRATRWDRRTTDDACEAEPLSATTSATVISQATGSSVKSSTSLVKSSSMVKLSSSLPHDSPAKKTSSAVAALESTTKSSCDDRAWYGDQAECDFKCFPETCTEVVDSYSNEFPSYVCECKGPDGPDGVPSRGLD